MTFWEEIGAKSLTSKFSIRRKRERRKRPKDESFASALLFMKTSMSKDVAARGILFFEKS
jgi:hypothetical protein